MADSPSNFYRFRAQSPALNSNISIVSKALVRQFQEEITFGQKRIQDLLRMAQLISAKLELTDLQRWIEYELDGYPNIKALPTTEQWSPPSYGTSTHITGGAPPLATKLFVLRLSNPSQS
jgi:hypothetical protein